MSQSPTEFARGKAKKGDPINSISLLETVNALEVSFKKMEVRGENGIEARIDWASGIPRIIIRKID